MSGKHNFKDLRGQTHHNVTVLHQIEGIRVRGQTVWRVRCNLCATEFDEKGYEIRTGKAKGCGCTRWNYCDLTGQTFGNLTVIKRGEKHPTKTSYYWLCVCSCGKPAAKTSEYLKKATLANCGCLKRGPKPRMGAPLESMPEYSVWQAMKSRCRNANDRSYKNYGARGITLCAEWSSFDAFLRDMGRRPTGKWSIDRVDNDKGYSKENCRWATDSEQAQNMRKTVRLTHAGITDTTSGWAERLGVPIQQIRSRISKKMPVERILDPRFPLPRIARTDP